VRFCRPPPLSQTLTRPSAKVTFLLSTTLNCYFSRLSAGTTLALLLSTLKRLASRGGRTRTSTRFPVLGRQFQKGGLHQPPFFISGPRILSPPSLTIRRQMKRPSNLSAIQRGCEPTSTGFRGKMRRKKLSGRWGFRPLGRGDGGKRNPKLLVTSRHYAALASSTMAHRSSLNCPGSRDQLPITIVIVLPGPDVGR
jgi:hypothetical protein